MLPSFNMLINNLDESKPESLKALKVGFNIYLSLFFVFLLSLYLYVFNVFLKEKSLSFYYF